MSENQSLEEKLAMLKQGLAEFASKIDANPGIKLMILEMLRSWMVGQNRNAEYYVIRDMVLPAMLGKEGTSFFIEMCKNGGPETLEVPAEHQEFLSVCNLGYGRFFWQAEIYSISPMQLANYNLTFNTKPPSTHISLSRADGTTFAFHINPLSYMDMVRFLIAQRETIEKIHGENIDFSDVVSSISR